MENKKIKKWEPEDFELEMTTHWSFPKRGDWATHDAKWRGNWSPYIPRNIILRYSQEGDLVLDQFAGGGTTLVEAKLLNRDIIGVDVNDAALDRCREKTDFDYEPAKGKVYIKKGDARMNSKKRLSLLMIGATVTSLMGGTVSTYAADNTETTEPLTIAEQGIFSAGGITITSDGTFNPEDQWEETGAGQTSHVDYANVLYQIPEEETSLPMVFLHGYGQSRMCWMTTPDGREGWAEMFLRDGHSAYLVDEPRRGEAGQTSVSGTISTKTLDQRWYTQFRIGRWEDGKSVPNEGSQFPNDDNSVDQFFRQMTPDTGMTSDMGGDFDNDVVAQALASTVDEVYERSGKDSILVTHSQGGGPGWTAAKYTDHIAAIVAIEPGGAPSSDSEDYQTVLEKKIPITMYFGDYIDNGDTAIQATGMWQGMRQACYDFADAYTKAGGNCTVVDLPNEGITGNDHFMFQDLNNDVIQEHIENWIQENVEA